MSDEHTPDSLADALDALLPPGEHGVRAASGGNPLLDAAARLAHATPPALSADALLRIEARMAQAQPIPQPALRFPRLIAAAAAAVVVLITGAVLVYMALRPQNGTIEVAVIATGVITETPTATPTVTVTDAPTDVATDVPAVIPTDAAAETPVIVPTDTPFEIPASPTQGPTDTPVPLPTRTPFGEAYIRIEGPITAIALDERTVTVYDFEITLASDEPLLQVLRVGDFVKLEGDLSRVDGDIRITVTEIVLDNPDDSDNLVEVGPQAGDIWRDDGSCANSPPPWAKATGWRARCETTPAPAGGSSSGQGQGNSPDVPPGQQDNPNSNRPDSPPGQSNNPGQGNPPDAPPGQSSNQGNPPDTSPGQGGGQENPNSSRPDSPPGQDK
jgi:hypothetical protein